MIKNNEDGKVERYDILSALRHLSMRPSQQISWLKSIGTYPCLDELAFEFSDALDAHRYKLSLGETSEWSMEILDDIELLPGNRTVTLATNFCLLVFYEEEISDVETQEAQSRVQGQGGA